MGEKAPVSTKKPPETSESRFDDAQKTDRVISSIHSRLLIAESQMDRASYLRLTEAFEKTKKEYYEKRWQTQEQARGRVAVG